MNDPTSPASPPAHAGPGLLESITRHDILNQLAVIQGHLSLALAGLPEGPLRDHISAALLASINIWKDIDFIREYQEMESRTPSWQDVEALFRRAALTSDLRGAVLKVDVRGLEVLADPLLAKALYNLVDNSLAHGGKVRTISVICREREGSVDITCSDDGAGIPAEERPRLFSRNTSRGLFLSREILGQNRMSIAENSRAGEGARFVISVPAGRYRFHGARAERSPR